MDSEGGIENMYPIYDPLDPFSDKRATNISGR